MRTDSLRPAAFVAVALATLAGSARAQGDADPRLDWWREARFGLFVHFGLYAVPEGRWGDRDGYGEWLLSSARVPLDEYEALADRFTVERFDAREWARLARRAGMRYVVVTTKHHDGFCLFDSAHTDWDVGRTPFARDMMREIAEGFRAEGLRVGWYHSIMDWHHPDYLPRRSWDTRPSDAADMDRYTAYLSAQVTELLTRYGPVDLMWFDGQWESTWNHVRGQALYDLCRKLQPGVVVNNRVDVGFGQDGLTTDARFAGDYGTPEQSVPGAPPPGVDWETCLTMNRHWGWNAADDGWKGAEELVRTLVDVVSKGGNLLLNVGPRPDGTFPPRAVERLEALGRWMDVNGEAIHGAGRAPFPRPTWGRLTQRTGDGTTRLYAHVLDPTAFEAGALVLDGIGNSVRDARALGAPERALAVTADPDVPGRLRVSLAGVTADPAATVLALTLEGAPLAYLAPGISAPTVSFVDALEVTVSPPSAGLGVAVTFDDTEVVAASGALTIGLREGATLVARTVHAGRAVGPEARATFVRATPRPAVGTPPDGAPAGARLTVADADLEAIGAQEEAWLARFTGAASRTVPGVALVPELEREHVAASHQAWLKVERDAVVTFELGSDDGSRLWVDGVSVVDNDGLHGFQLVRGEAALAAGWHALTVAWFNKTGGASLELRAAAGGAPLAALPPESLRAR